MSLDGIFNVSLFLPCDMFADCLFRVLPMQHYSAQMQYSKAIQSQSEPFMEKEKMTAKFRGVVMLKQFEVSVCLSVCQSVSLCVYDNVTCNNNVKCYT